MSSHPNAMLLLVLTPDDLARKTYRAILDEAGIGPDDGLKLGEQHFGCNYSHKVMETDWDESHQISAPEGSIIFHTYLTYGYGERLTWAQAVAYQEILDKWAQGVCERHRCKAEIFVCADYF